MSNALTSYEQDIFDEGFKQGYAQARSDVFRRMRRMCYKNEKGETDEVCLIKGTPMCTEDTCYLINPKKEGEIKCTNTNNAG